MGNRTCDALEGLDQVTIGCVNGLAIGAGVVFLACLDMRIAAESAWFSIPEVQLDIPLPWNALPRLMRELGPARTRELVMTSDRFSSEQALAWGFVNHVVPDAELASATRDLVARLLSRDPLAIALTKSTTRSLARQMVPDEPSQSDREYLMLARALRAERERQ
jgi:enoyl-CoA hydratase/carnithine racemase